MSSCKLENIRIALKVACGFELDSMVNGPAKKLQVVRVPNRERFKMEVKFRISNASQLDTDKVLTFWQVLKVDNWTLEVNLRHRRVGGYPQKLSET